VAQELFSGITTLEFPDGPCEAMPVPTGDLEAAFRTTRASNVTAYAVSPPVPNASASEAEIAGARIPRSFGWARATSSAGSTVTALLQTGDSYSFTPAASLRAVEETLKGSHSGALSPASAFGTDFVLTIQDTASIDLVEMKSSPVT
jgi:hypothetical protein